MEFRPSPKLKIIYWLYSLPGLIPLTLIALILMAQHSMLALPSLIAFSIIVIFLAYWIPKFQITTIFKLEEAFICSKYGVWWRKESRIPLSSISEIKLRQGPIQKILKLANLDIKIAKKTNSHVSVTCFQLDYENAIRIKEELKRKIDSEAFLFNGGGTLEEILEELRRIRE